MNNRSATLGWTVLGAAAIASLAYIAFGGDDDEVSPSRKPAPAATSTITNDPVSPTASPLPPPSIVAPVPSEQRPPPAVEAGACGPGQELVDETFDEGTRGRGCAQRVDGARLNQGRWSLLDTKGFTLSGDYVNGKREGTWTAWYPNGDVFQKVDFVRDKKHGTWIQWGPDGRKKFEHQYRDDRLDGTSTVYNADGGIERSFWRDGQRVDDGK